MASAARDLAREVAASLGADLKGKVLVDSNPANLSAASSFDFQQGCASFSAELASEGVTVPPANSQQAAATVHLTLSSNFRGFVWVADITEASARKIFFSAVVPPSAATALPAAPQLTLQKVFLLSSPDPILDAEILPSASAGTPPNLLILQPESISQFTQINGAWQKQSHVPIQHVRPWPRDLRGRLQQEQNDLDAELPGTIVLISMKPTLSISSNWIGGIPGGLSIAPPSLPPQQAGFNQGRNTFYFYLADTPTDFDSVLRLPPESPGETAPVLGTTPEGRASLFEGSATPVASFSGWGTDIAALWSRSRQRWPILVTRDGDWSEPDAIQAFDIVDRQAVPVSAPVDFDGPITALWSEGENEALAVSRNLKTGLYEAYLLRATYNQ